jgi:cytochrome c peroxidase
MKYYFYLIAVGSLLACSPEDEPLIEPEQPEPVEQFGFSAPEHFPEPVYQLDNNPVTEDGFILGRKLFYDGKLSRDGTVSCGSCHMQNSAFTQHGHVLSHGIDDKLTRRNSQPIQNLAWQPSFFWDGGVGDLDLFALHPITADNEMDETVANVLNKLRQDDEYPELFWKAFNDTITTANFLKALSQFQLMCISNNSRYDKYMRNELELDEEELAGKVLFEQKCSSCHAGTLQTDNSFRNNGLPRGSSTDYGRQEITLNEADSFKFRVPSLRNIEYTFPYMHDGRFQTLKQVLDHYDSGVEDAPNLDSNLRLEGGTGIPLTEEEKQKLFRFLRALSDVEFLRNPELSEFAVE